MTGFLPSGASSYTTAPSPDTPGSNTNVTLNSSPIREGVTVAGNTTLGVGTSALLNPGLGDRVIRTTYDSNTIYQAGSAQAPEGWTLEYSVDSGSTWSQTEPASASSVTDIRARKSSVAAGAIDGYSQEYSTETLANIPSSTFNASSGGDGWGVAFYDDYIFNIYHHANQTKLECKYKSTGLSCPNAITQITDVVSNVTINYRASDRSDIAVNALDGELYAITSPTAGTYQNYAGVLCIDVKVSPPASCGFTPLEDSATAIGYWYLTDMTKAGDRYFSTTMQSKVQLLCYDSTTNAKCANSPVVLENSVASSARTMVYGDRVYVKSSTKLYCYLISNLAACPEVSWPISFSAVGDWDIVLHTDTAGTPDGLCIRELTNCVNFNGASQSSWVNPYTQISVGSLPQYSRGVTTIGRWYLTHYYPPGVSGSIVKCWDFSTNAECANFTSLVTGLWYQVTVDPENPACLWLNSDGRQIRNFDAYTGAGGCTANPVVTLQPSQFAPRYACSTTNGIDQWLSLRLASLVGGGSASTISLTIRNPQGVAVTNWTNRVIGLNTPIDMSALDVLQTGSRPTFSFAFSGVTGTITSAVVQLDYKGKGPELCSEVKTSTPASNTDAVIKGFLEDTVGLGLTYESRRNFTIGGTGVQTQVNINQSVPSAPRNLTGTGLNTSATLTFQPPSDNGGLDLGSYNLSLDGGQSWTVVSNLVDNGDGTYSIPLSNLVAGSSYPIRLAATNVLGRGASASLNLAAQTVSLSNLGDTELSSGPIYMATQSNNALPYTYVVTPSSVCTVSGTVISLISTGSCSVTQNQAGDANNIATTASTSFNVLPDPVVATVPGIPLNLQATPSSQQVALSWLAPSSNGGASVSDYIVQYKVGSSWIPFTDGVSAATSTVITGLTNGTTYNFKVAAVNSVGQGLFTDAVSSSPATVPGAPTNLSPNKSGTSATLTWTAPGQNGGSAILDYLVDYKLTSEATWTSFSDTVTSTTGATVTGLLSGSNYDFRVRTKNAVGLSSPVSTVNLTASNSSGSIGLSWSAPNTGGASITNYIIQYRLSGQQAWTDQDTSSTSTTGTISGLVNGDIYEVRVAAVVLDGNSNPVVSSYTSTVEGAPFSAPGAPSVSLSPGNQQLIVSWSTPITNGSAITDYRIQYRATGSNTWITATDGVSTLTSHTLINLTNGTEYEVQVSAQNTAGFGSSSAVVSATPRTVPGPVSGLTLTAGSGLISLSWSAPVNNGGSPIIDYEIQYKLLTSTNWTTLNHDPFTSTSHQIPDLLGLTRYSVRVAAINAAGTGSFGSAGSEVTLQVVYQITWDATSNGGSPVSPSTQSFSPGDPALIAPTPGPISGKTLLGWFNHPTAGQKVVDAGSALSPASTTTLYARWSSSGSGSQESQVSQNDIYLGPIFTSYSKRDPVPGEVISAFGSYLNLVKTIQIDGIECQILSHTASKIEFVVPSKATNGFKDLDVTYNLASKLMVQKAIEVVAPEILGPTGREKVNMNVFGGKLSLYQRGHSGSSISWRLNGKWGKAKADKWYQWWHVPTGQKGKRLNLEIYINGELMMSRSVQSK